MKKNLHKINDVIDNEAISNFFHLLKNTQNRNRKDTINSLINGHIMLKFWTMVAHDKLFHLPNKILKSALTS